MNPIHRDPTNNFPIFEQNDALNLLDEQTMAVSQSILGKRQIAIDSAYEGQVKQARQIDSENALSSEDLTWIDQLLERDAACSDDLWNTIFVPNPSPEEIVQLAPQFENEGPLELEVDVEGLLAADKAFEESKQSIPQGVPRTEIDIKSLMETNQFDDVLKIDILMKLIEDLMRFSAGTIDGHRLITMFLPENLFVKKVIKENHWSLMYNIYEVNPPASFSLPEHMSPVIKDLLIGKNPRPDLNAVNLYTFGKLIEEYFPDTATRNQIPGLDLLIKELTEIPQDEYSVTCTLLHTKKGDIKKDLEEIKKKMKSKSPVKLTFQF